MTLIGLDSKTFNRFFKDFTMDNVVKNIIEYFISQWGKKVQESSFYKFSRRENKFHHIYPHKRVSDQAKLQELLKQSYQKKNIIKKDKTLIVPLVYSDKCLAVLAFVFKSKISFNVNPYKSIIDIFSLIYYTVNIYNLAIRDPLTRLFNKRFFQYKSEEIWEESRSNKIPLSIIMIDIDHFKHYNDVYGHPVGDKILRVISQKISHYLSGSSLLARYGGEEFIILNQKDRNETVQLAERIRNGIENLKIMTDEYFWRLTISLGVSVFPDDGKDMAQIINRADKALYISKKSGRNRVTVYHAAKK